MVDLITFSAAMQICSMIRAVLQQGRFRFGTMIVFPELSLRSPHQIWVNCTDGFDKCNLPDGMDNYRVLAISELRGRLVMPRHRNAFLESFQQARCASDLTCPLSNQCPHCNLDKLVLITAHARKTCIKMLRGRPAESRRP